MEDRRMADGLFKVGSKNGTAMLGVSLWQQLGPLQGVLPTSVQVCFPDFSSTSSV